MDIRKNTLQEPSHETVAFMENSTVLIWKNSQNLSYSPHWHMAMEVIIPLENYYHVSVNEKDYHLLPYDILIIPPGEIHTLLAPETGIRNIYLIDISFLTQIKGISASDVVLKSTFYAMSTT